MNIDRTKLYRFPWSKTDNPGGWIEVTDQCNLVCPGCYRSQLAGHRTLDDIKQDILDTKRLTNCDCMTIAGGEPLFYPHLTEVIEFISRLKVKPILFTNGEKLIPETLRELKKAGLVNIHFHIDNAQERPEWIGKSESEMNVLREHYANMLYETVGIQCGFHVTVFRSNLEEIPDIVGWALKNIHKVQHISFIAYRAIPADDHLQFFADGKMLEKSHMTNIEQNINDISISTEEMFAKMNAVYPELRPSAYLNGTAVHESNKFLIVVNVGSKGRKYGLLGAKTMELTQMFYHFFNGRYYTFLNSPNAGKKLFLMSLFDKEIRKTSRNYLAACLRNPMRLADKIYVQSIHFQQPNEIVNGEVNLCDDCVNMMAYKGKLINPCRLDEYRLYGDAMHIVKIK